MSDDGTLHYYSEQSLLVVLNLLLVAGGNHGGCRDNAEHTKGYTSVESSPAWLLGCGGGGMLLSKGSCPPFDVSRVTDGFLEIVSNSIDQILNHWSNFFLHSIFNLTVKILVLRLEIIANFESCISNLLHLPLDTSEPVVKLRLSWAVETDGDTGRLFLHDGMTDGLGTFQLFDKDPVHIALGGHLDALPKVCITEPDRPGDFVGKRTECNSLPFHLFLLPLDKFRSPLFHHVINELFTFFLSFLDRFNDVVDRHKVKIDFILDKFVLHVRLLVQYLCELFLLCCGELSEEIPLAI